MSYCSVPGCKSGYGRKRDGRHCFTPPKEDNLFSKWATAIPRKDKQLSVKSRICDLHFTSDLIVKTDSFVVKGENVELPRVRWKLKPGAVPNVFSNLPKYLSTEVKSQKSPSKRRIEANIKRPRKENHDVSEAEIAKVKLENCFGIMEDPHFIKSEPEWSPDDEEILKRESKDCFLTDNSMNVKAEAEYSSDADLNADDENQNSFSGNKTQILKEEIIKEEEDINTRTDSLDLPPSSWNVLQESGQDLNLNNGMTCEDESKYPCLQCDKMYRNEANLKRHVNDTHNRKGSYECKECKRLFAWPQNLREHLKIHGAEKAFQCDLCERSFHRAAEVRRHMAVHTGERKFPCALCPKMFGDLSNLRSHIKLHSGARPYSCNICNKAFQTKGNLKKHIMIHSRFV